MDDTLVIVLLWLGFAATVSVGLFGLLTLIFAARAFARARTASRADVPTDRAAQE